MAPADVAAAHNVSVRYLHLVFAEQGTTFGQLLRETYYEIPYRDTSRPAVSRYEIREARGEARWQGIEDIDEQVIFETIERLRQRVEEAKERTKDTRRKAQRQRQTEARERQQKAIRDTGKRQKTSPSPETRDAPETALARGRTYVADDIFAEEIKPYERRVSSQDKREES